MNKLKRLISITQNLQYDNSAYNDLEDIIKDITSIVRSGHFLNIDHYLKVLDEAKAMTQNLSTFKSDEDRLLQRRIQKKITDLLHSIVNENKKIFVVHGRNLNMRDQVASLLGRLKLDYTILEHEYNFGATIIEKFISNAIECDYAVVIFSGDDVGYLKDQEGSKKLRPRQNVILELGYFLGTIGRKNICILHETEISLEKPSDFAGIVYEPMDHYGAWKNKLIKEMKTSGIYIDPKLADRV